MTANSLRLLGNRIGQAALYLFCLSAFLAPAVAAASMVALAIAFALVTPSRQTLREPVVAIALGFALFVTGHTVIAAVLNPDATQGLREAAVSWLQLLIFIPFAFFLAANTDRLGQLLALVLLGLIGGMLLRLDWGLLFESPEALFASRPGFGFTAIAYSLYSGSAILGLIFLARRWWGIGHSGVGAASMLTLWSLCLAILIQGFVAAQSRGSWIAFGVALIVGLWLSRRSMPQHPPARLGRTGRLAIAMGFCALVTLLALNGERILSRMTAEVETTSALLRGEHREAAGSSFTQRWNALWFGIDRFLERPWLGWGAGSSRRLMEQSGDPGLQDREKTLRHLHNTYLDVAVQFGAIGAALVGTLVLLLLRGLWRAVREGRCPADIGVFLLTEFVFTLVWSLWNYRVVHQDWRVFWVLLAGASLSCSPILSTRRT